jgi:hypothetical protein
MEEVRNAPTILVSKPVEKKKLASYNIDWGIMLK